MLFIVPLEKYEERYTEQWSRWIPEALKELKIPFVNVEGETLTESIETGKVLDVYGTHYYKFAQLQQLVKMLRNKEIKDGDTIWFADLWFPGIEALAYIRNMEGVDFKIKGVLHAGTWDKHDFTYMSGMRAWGKWIEQGWLEFVDEIFLGSEFHKQLIEDNNLFVKSKLTVTGLFFDHNEVSKVSEKENIVVFAHRITEEKRPDLFDSLITELSPLYPEWLFIKTIEVTKGKKDYLELLGKAKISVSFAEQETFGYSMLESMANKCIPVVPNRLSYTTMPIYDTWRFTDYEEAKKMVKFFMNDTENIFKPDFSDELEEFLPINIIKKMFLC